MAAKISSHAGFPTCQAQVASGRHVGAALHTNLDRAPLQAARAHPIVLLNALRMYVNGHGDKGSMQVGARPLPAQHKLWPGPHCTAP